MAKTLIIRDLNIFNAEVSDGVFLWHVADPLHQTNSELDNPVVSKLFWPIFDS